MGWAPPVTYLMIGNTIISNIDNYFHIHESEKQEEQLYLHD